MSTERKLFWLVVFVCLVLAGFHLVCEKIVFVFNLRGVLVTQSHTTVRHDGSAGLVTSARVSQEVTRAEQISRA